MHQHRSGTMKTLEGGPVRVKKVKREGVFLGEGVPRMKKVKRQEVFLPQDLVVSEILSRLPTKSMLKLRCVCKSWSALTRDNNFVLHHSRTRSRPSILLLSVTNVLLALYSCNGVDTAHFLTNKEVSTSLHLRASPVSCNGLLLLYAEEGYACVLSPSMHERMQLPAYSLCSDRPGSFGPSPGLAYSPATQEYKVVHPFYCSVDHGMRTHSTACEVFTLGTASWRRVVNPPYPAASDKDPALVNGFLHWMIDARLHPSRSQAIMAFNIADETFSVVRHPPCCNDPFKDRGSMYLVVLDECLCLVYDHSGGSDVWKLEDYARGVWRKAFTIASRNVDGDRRRVVAMHEGKVLLAPRREDRELDYYDPTSHEYGTIIGQQKRFSCRWGGFWGTLEYDPQTTHDSFEQLTLEFMALSLHTDSLVSAGDTSSMCTW